MEILHPRNKDFERRVGGRRLTGLYIIIDETVEDEF
jgi:hypothetical protein